jgi:hypothetical protein
MKLLDLDASFLKHEGEGYRMVPTLAEADGVMFQCPRCAQGKEAGAEDGRRFVRGAHYVICWFVGKVADSVDPKPGRWTPQGTGLADLTFVPGNPSRSVSVLLTSGCGWHGFIRDGEATLS